MTSRSRKMKKATSRESSLTYDRKRLKKAGKGMKGRLKAITGTQGDEGYNRSSLHSHHSLLSAIYEPFLSPLNLRGLKKAKKCYEGR
jgi:hypothetical protein